MTNDCEVEQGRGIFWMLLQRGRKELGGIRGPSSLKPSHAQPIQGFLILGVKAQGFVKAPFRGGKFPGTKLGRAELGQGRCGITSPEIVGRELGFRFFGPIGVRAGDSPG